MARALSDYLLRVLKQAGNCAKGTAGGSSGQPSGTTMQSQSVKGYTVELTAATAQSGTYTFTMRPRTRRACRCRAQAFR